MRPLYDDGAEKAQSATRDYVLALADKGGAPLLSVFGGKIITYRRLAMHALDRLAPFLSKTSQGKAGWTAAAPLPGGDFPVHGFDALAASLAQAYPWLAPRQARRMARAHGSRAQLILGKAKSVADLGRDFGAGLSGSEAA